MISSKRTVVFQKGQEVEDKTHPQDRIKSQIQSKRYLRTTSQFGSGLSSFILYSVTLNYKFFLSQESNVFSSGFPSKSLFKAGKLQGKEKILDLMVKLYLFLYQLQPQNILTALSFLRKVMSIFEDSKIDLGVIRKLYSTQHLLCIFLLTAFTPTFKKQERGQVSFYKSPREQFLRLHSTTLCSR